MVHDHPRRRRAGPRPLPTALREAWRRRPHRWGARERDGTTLADLADAGLVVEASRARGSRSEPRRRTGRRRASRRHRDDRLDRRPNRPSNPCSASTASPAVASPNFSLGVALSAGSSDAAVGLFGQVRRVRSLPRRVAPALEAGPPVRDGRRRSPGGSSPASALSRRPTISRSSRSGPAPRPACTWWRSTPRRDGRAAADRPRPVGLCGRDPRRRRLAGPTAPRARASTPSTPSSTSSSLALAGRRLTGSMTPPTGMTPTDPAPALRGAFTALVTPFTRRRRSRRGCLPPPRPLADPGRDRRPRPVRHDRRGPDPQRPTSASA